MGFDYHLGGVFMIINTRGSLITSYPRLNIANVVILTALTISLCFSSKVFAPLFLLGFSFLTWSLFANFNKKLFIKTKKEKLYKNILIQGKLLIFAVLSLILLKFNNENFILFCIALTQNFFILAVNLENKDSRNNYGVIFVYLLTILAIFGLIN